MEDYENKFVMASQ
jgi:predicted RNase H-like nuclease (RuvC/YqgF family)